MKLMPKSKPGKIRLSLLGLLLGVSVYCFLIEPFYYLLEYEPREGDIVAQALPVGELTQLIEGATHSNYSHVGILVNRNGKLMVNEAIQNVHDTPLFNWIRRGRRNRFAVYRLKAEYQPVIPQMITELEKYQARPYDFRYDFDDGFIYCSELIFKSFKDATGNQMGKIQSLGELNWKPYKDIILKMEYGNLPLERTMITPIELVKSKYLEKVYDNGL
jgi:hypothetical protein